MAYDILNKYLSACIIKKKFPGCVCWVGNHRNTFFFESFGHAQIIPEKVKLEKETIFDLASITKPMATALSIMLLFEQKELKLDDPIEKFLPGFKHRINGKKTIKEMLCHTSGIPAWFPTYLLDRKKRVEFLATSNTGEKKVIYSCLGYIILGLVVQAITKLKLNEYCDQYIFKRIGLNNTGFGPIKKTMMVVATELENEHEKKKAAQYGDIKNVNWRDYLIRGEVHDGNAFYSYKGIAGNAGLFSNAQDLAKFSRAYLNGGIVKPSTVKTMTKSHTRGKEKRGLGWLVDIYPGMLSSLAFGHTGFTGTLLAIDPKQNLIIILLANAVHPHVRLDLMPKIRRKAVKIITDSLIHG